MTKAGRSNLRTPRRAVMLGAMLVAVGCASAPRSTPTPSFAEPSAACVVAAAGAASPESLSVATAGQSNLAPTDRGFAAAQIYETLINVDCERRAYAGLAESWTTDATGTRVTLTLRRGASFWGGDPVLARDVVAAWRAAGQPVADATTVVDDRRLIVSLPDTALGALADRSLAIHRAISGSAWAEGSGPYRIVDGATLSPVGSASAPRLVIRSRSGADGRDAIDAGADLVLAADPQTVRYSATRSNLAAIPLPWTRTYVFAGRTAATDWGVLSGDGAAFRESLASDAVRAEARAAAPRGWWSDLSGCEFRDLSAVPSRSVDSRAAPRVVYRADDQVARALAERLVAVRRGAVAAPLSPADFARALHGGTEAGYVVSLPRESLSRCRDVVALRSSAPWLGTGGPVSESLLPLVDTRERAILDRARVSVVIDWDGTLRMISRRP